MSDENKVIRQIIKPDTDKKRDLLQKLLLLVSAALAIGGVFIDVRILILFAVAAGSAWYLKTKNQQGYEYLFSGDELEIDAMVSGKRKVLGTFMMEEMELFTDPEDEALRAFEKHGTQKIKACNGNTKYPRKAVVFRVRENYIIVFAEFNEELSQVLNL